ncbi:hypothetical protein V495_00145 [Pseudogymnoascus sp. VKM F-4514 (FW-929)]|nr:hypothetical protein V495_00145 [Pseudogymnoascus sp. VKM F-4514 (FW-929)]KFY67469.1 hypothetical protein V497_00371 [Pseudogymnoascus sp. VKM F-4516 (FW-969)]
MPIVSKRRFLNDHLNPLNVQRSDIALLCLSMKLVMWSPSPESPDSHTTTYLVARQFLYSVDISASLTLPTLQAAILIAIYEIGHAIYPGAHTSVSVCVQNAIAMGLGWKSVRWGENNLSWTETEERARVWWAIVILERYIYLGWPRRPLMSEGPGGGELLPSDDAAWDEGNRAPKYAMTASTPVNINMGPFARLAQATHLLDRVLRHVQDSAMPAKPREEEAVQLDQALRALVAFTAAETTQRQMKLCCHTALCHSAMALLHRRYLTSQCTDSDVSVHRRSLARDTMDRVSLEFFLESKKILSGEWPSLDTTSPLVLHWGYEASLHLARSVRAEPQEGTGLALETVQSALQKTNTRWKAAGAYLNILLAHQVTSSTLD